MMLTILAFVAVLPKVFLELIYLMMDVIDEEFVLFLADSVYKIFKYLIVGATWFLCATVYLAYNEYLFIRKAVVAMG